MRRPLFQCVVLLGSILVTAGCNSAPVPGAPGGPGGVIAFVAGGNVMQFDLATRHVTGVRPGRDPARSLAGDDVFISEDHKLCGKEVEDRCVMIAAAGGGPSPLVKSCKGCEHASLSPDGTRIAYAGYCREKLCGDASHATFVRDRKGKILHVFPSLAGPAWTPDGQLILVGDALKGRVGLYLSTDLVHEARIDTNLADPKEVSVSPDGKWIAFKQAGADGQVYRIGVDGANVKKLTDLDDHTAAWPIWSPDGKWLLIQNKERSWQDGDLAYVSAEGGSATLLLDDKKQPVKAGGRMQWRPAL